jgi:hypothetical protein
MPMRAQPSASCPLPYLACSIVEPTYVSTKREVIVKIAILNIKVRWTSPSNVHKPHTTKHASSITSSTEKELRIMESQGKVEPRGIRS